ncbi:MAG: phage GP46 family protein [Rhodospirillaceae bacterium]
MDLKTAFDSDGLVIDWTLSGGSLDTDEGLQTAVVISWFTDARAPEGVELPEGATDRRGWWGDVVAPSNVPTDRPWTTGSLLWLLSREKQTAETARRARDYAADALAWMTSLGVALSVDVTAEWEGVGQLNLTAAITRPDGSVQTFTYLWSLK